jgi:cytosine permease
VLIVAQFVLQLVGAMGGVVSGNADFTGYMRTAGPAISLFGLIAMSFALWTTGDANLYLPAIQTASLLKRPKRVMVVILGLLGTVLGLGIYQQFMTFIGILANIVPPLIGPVIVDYYLCNRRRFDPALLPRLPAWNWLAVLGFAGGAVASFYPPAWLAAGLYALLVSMAIYAVLYAVAHVAGLRIGYARALADTTAAATR